MVLSNTKLKRKKREETAAAAVLIPPPDSNATSSLANDVKGDSPAVLSVKKKKNKRQKSKAVNGDANDGAAGSVPEAIRDTNIIPEEGKVSDVVPMQKSKKKQKIAHVIPMEVEDVGKTLDSSEGAGNCEKIGNGGGAHEAGPMQEEAPKTKNRKKPRWELDENGKRLKPQKVGGEGVGPSNGTVTVTTSAKVTQIGDVLNGLTEKDGDAAVAVGDAVNDGDRIHQGDEPWLQSKRSKKKKKLTDRWGKKLNDAEAVGADLTANQEASVLASSTEEKGDPKKVMVGGMPYYISEDDIHEYFRECGTIAELDCMTFPDTGKFKGIAFITFREEQMTASLHSSAVDTIIADASLSLGKTLFDFKTEEAAKRALALDGGDMGGRFLKIEICKSRPREPTKKDAYKEPPKKVEGCLSAYIGNLSWDVTEKELRKFFKGCKIDSIRFAVNKETGEFRGFGHVDFSNDESLEAAMKLDQMAVLDRPLKLAYSVPPKFKTAEGRPGQPGDRKKGCFTCGEEGHMSYNCPK